MKILTLKITAVILIWCGCQNVLQAEETIFQRELNQYQGAKDSTLSANPESEATKNLWGDEFLYVAGVPNAGKKRMALIRFDDLFGSGKHQIPFGARIVGARLGLYKIGEEADNGQYSSLKPDQLNITLHAMLKPFQPREPESDSNTYSCHSFRSYGAGSDEYWGDKNKIEPGPVPNVDYAGMPVGRIPLEVAMLDTWYWVDVSEQVSGWAAGKGNHGFLLLAHGWWIGASFASGQYSDSTLRPQLVVEWEK